MGAEHVGTQWSVPANARAAVILGNDAVVAAGACTSDQLASACRAAGFDIVVPPTWGDELVAAHYLELIGRCGERVAAACACPRVRSLAAQIPPEHAPACVTLAAPPVAAARYLRALHGDELLITYVGDCPSSSDPSIDACFSPTGFLVSLQRQGISIGGQTRADAHGDATVWPRHLSTPGGLPALRFLARAPVDRVVREADLGTIVASTVRGRANVVVDLALAAGCVCSAHRDQIEEREPPRSALPVIAAVPGLNLGPDPSSRPRRQRARVRRAVTEFPAHLEGNPPKSIAGEPAPVMAPIAPPAAVEGEAGLSATPVRAAVSAPAVSTTRAPRLERRPSRGRPIVLLALPLAILGAVTALGVAAYSTGASVRDASAKLPAASIQRADSVIPGAASLGDFAAPASADSELTQRDTVRGADSSSVRAVVAPDSTVATDSLPKQGPRRPRRPPAEVIPGWMPQGQSAWTPDGNIARKRDSTTARPRPDSVPPAPRQDTLPPA